MGSSQPTISQQIDAYRAANATFRAWLPVQGQARLDRLVEALYRAGPALNMTEDLDFYRRALLVGLIDLGAEFDRRMAAVELATGLRKPVGLERFVLGSVPDRTASQVEQQPA